MTGRACARASANIALAKYWGKDDVLCNLPAVPSLSLTLADLYTVTRVSFDATLSEDVLEISGVVQTGRAKARASELLDRVRALGSERRSARVQTHNNFPTASGLASSASGFAALALASTRAAGLTMPLSDVSAMARQSSASAARSLFGGWVALDHGAESARRVAPPEALDVRMIVAVTHPGPKSVGSTEGMQHTAKTSPYYAAWIAHAPELFRQVEAALTEGDLDALGEAAAQSALMMHACMWAARPPLIYFRPATLGVLQAIAELREQGVRAFPTMDAGPHVKVLVPAADAAAVEARVRQVEGVTGSLQAAPGPDARLIDDDEADLSLTPGAR